MERELTFGEKAVGLTFNPSNDPKVQEVKELYAKIIDELNLILENSGGSMDVVKFCSIAITNAIQAQMWAVKAITWK